VPLAQSRGCDLITCADVSSARDLALALAANQAAFDYRMSLYQLEQATGQSWVKP
jgi:hypothetical protein